MKVKELMTQKVITVSPDDSLDKVFFLFNFENIRHLPVLEDDRVVGIISDRDLKKVLGPSKDVRSKSKGMPFNIPSKKVTAVMRSDVLVTGPEERAADVAAIMVAKKIGVLPVVQNEKLVGIVSAIDILKAFVGICNNLEQVDFKAFGNLLNRLESITKIKESG